MYVPGYTYKCTTLTSVYTYKAYNLGCTYEQTYKPYDMMIVAHPATLLAYAVTA